MNNTLDDIFGYLCIRSSASLYRRYVTVLFVRSWSRDRVRYRWISKSSRKRERESRKTKNYQYPDICRNMLLVTRETRGLRSRSKTWIQKAMYCKTLCCGETDKVSLYGFRMSRYKAILYPLPGMVSYLTEKMHIHHLNISTAEICNPPCAFHVNRRHDRNRLHRLPPKSTRP